MKDESEDVKNEIAKAAEYIKHVEDVYESDEFSKYCDMVYNDPIFIDLKVSTMEKRRLLKFFVSCHGDVQESNKALQDALKWRISYNYENLLKEDFSRHEEDKKLLTLQGKSKHGYPVMIWISRRHIAKKYDYKKTIRYIIYVLEKAISDGKIPYRIVFLIDRSLSTNSNMESMSFMRILCHALQVNFPEALHKLIIFPSSFWLDSLWAIVKHLLNRAVIERVLLLSEVEYKKSLLSIIPSEYLLKSYGGTAPDIEGPNDNPSKM